jgi:hypothetical protein
LMVTWASGGSSSTWISLSVPASIITNIGKNRFAFGVVGGCTACEDQPKRWSKRFRQSIGFDYAQKILETIKA